MVGSYKNLNLASSQAELISQLLSDMQTLKALRGSIPKPGNKSCIDTLYDLYYFSNKLCQYNMQSKVVRKFDIETLQAGRRLKKIYPISDLETLLVFYSTSSAADVYLFMPNSSRLACIPAMHQSRSVCIYIHDSNFIYAFETLKQGQTIPPSGRFDLQKNRWQKLPTIGDIVKLVFPITFQNKIIIFTSTGKGLALNTITLKLTPFSIQTLKGMGLIANRYLPFSNSYTSFCAYDIQTNTLGNYKLDIMTLYLGYTLSIDEKRIIYDNKICYYDSTKNSIHKFKLNPPNPLIKSRDLHHYKENSYSRYLYNTKIDRFDFKRRLISQLDFKLKNYDSNGVSICLIQNCKLFLACFQDCYIINPVIYHTLKLLVYQKLEDLKDWFIIMILFIYSVEHLIKAY